MSLDEVQPVQQIKQEPVELAPQQQLHSRGYRKETQQVQHAGSFDPYEYRAQQAQRAISAGAFRRSLSRCARRQSHHVLLTHHPMQHDGSAKLPERRVLLDIVKHVT